MKKAVITILSVVLIFALVIPCFAAGESLSLTSANANPGDTVYLTVILNESVVGNTIGISYTYNKDHLKAVPSSNSWEKAGILNDFNRKGSGVWASSTAGDLKGTICTLAFTVSKDVPFDRTEVSCKVVVKNNSKEIGTYSAKAEVSQSCAHQYGQWSDAGLAGHSRTCSKCQAKQTAAHTWDDGVIKEKPDDYYMSYKIYTCTVCGGTKQQEVTNPTAPTHSQETKPTVPEITPVTKPTNTPTKPSDLENTKPTRPADSEATVPTRPTTPETRPTFPTSPTTDTRPGTLVTVPTKPTTAPTQPTKPAPTEPTVELPTVPSIKPTEPQKESTGPQDYNAPTIVEESHEGHDHSSGQVHGIPNDVQDNGNKPIIVPIAPTEENLNDSSLEHDHNHEEIYLDTAAGISPPTVIAILAVLAAALAAALWYLKKKH